MGRGLSELQRTILKPQDFFEQIGNQSRISFDGVIDVRPVMQEDQRIAKQIGRRLGAADQEENASPAVKIRFPIAPDSESPLGCRTGGIISGC